MAGCYARNRAIRISHASPMTYTLALHWPRLHLLSRENFALLQHLPVDLFTGLLTSHTWHSKLCEALSLMHITGSDKGWSSEVYRWGGCTPPTKTMQKAHQTASRKQPTSGGRRVGDPTHLAAESQLRRPCSCHVFPAHSSNQPGSNQPVSVGEAPRLAHAEHVPFTMTT